MVHSQENADIKEMYLANYDAYSRHPCNVGECACAALGAGMKRYTEKFCGDMDDLSRSVSSPQRSSMKDVSCMSLVSDSAGG